MIQNEEFVVLLKNKEVPHTRHVRGSNYCLMNVFPDRIPGRAIIISVVSFSRRITSINPAQQVCYYCHLTSKIPVAD